MSPASSLSRISPSIYPTQYPVSNGAKLTSREAHRQEMKADPCPPFLLLKLEAAWSHPGKYDLSSVKVSKLLSKPPTLEATHTPLIGSRPELSI